MSMTWSGTLINDLIKQACEAVDRTPAVERREHSEYFAVERRLSVPTSKILNSLNRTAGGPNGSEKGSF